MYLENKIVRPMHVQIWDHRSGKMSRPKILTCRDGAYLDTRQADNLNKLQFLFKFENIIFKYNTKSHKYWYKHSPKPGVTEYMSIYYDYNSRKFGL